MHIVHYEVSVHLCVSVEPLGLDAEYVTVTREEKESAKQFRKKTRDELKKLPGKRWAKVSWHE